MPQRESTKVEPFVVRRTVLNTSNDPKDMSPLGRLLMKLAAEIDASDEPAMSEEDIERRLRLGRGGYTGDYD